MLVTGVLTIAGLIAFLHVFAWQVPGLIDPFFWYAFHAIALIVACVIVVYGLSNLLMDREFRFTLSEDRIECRSPSHSFGPSYSILVDEIVLLEEDTSDDLWYFTTRDNRRIVITPNYGNPVRRIAKALQQLRPAMPFKRS